MTRLVYLVTVLGMLWLAGDAHAQFANRSIRFSLGYLDVKDDPSVSHGFPLGLGYTGYIEAGWELTFDVQGMLLTYNDRQFIGMAGGPGLRYLFMEETLRPYAGMDISYLHLFHPNGTSSFVGLGPKAGVEYFVTDSLSLGVKGQVNLYWMLNQPLQISVGLHAVAAAWF
jgi:outer membrane protein